MAKPDSIKKFDYLYIGSIVVGALGLLLGWGALMDQVNAELAAQGLEPEGGFATGAIIGGFVFGTALSLALWFLVSVLRIEFVKWILLAFLLYGLFTMFVGVSQTGFDLVQVFGIISTIMSAAAIYMLFRPDAKEWFAAKRGD